MRRPVENSLTSDPCSVKYIIAEALGGVSLDEIQSHEEMRADYACLRGLLAVEVKTLEEDASVRLSNLTDELEKREDWPLYYGAWPVYSVVANLTDPELVRRRVADRIGRAIINDLKHANHQLAAHAEAFPRSNQVRMVVLINGDHEIYDPAFVASIIQRALARIEGGRPKYEYIDAVMFLTERHATRLDGNISFPIITVTGHPLDGAKWKGSVLDYVASKWSDWNGALHVASDAEAVESFSTIEHIPEQMRRQDLWALEYRRRPYMRSWTEAQIRDRWDEVILRSLFATVKSSPLHLSQDELTIDLERFAHLQQEIARLVILVFLRQAVEYTLAPCPIFRDHLSPLGHRVDEHGPRESHLNCRAKRLTWIHENYETAPKSPPTHTQSAAPSANFGLKAAKPRGMARARDAVARSSP